MKTVCSFTVSFVQYTRPKVSLTFLTKQRNAKDFSPIAWIKRKFLHWLCPMTETQTTLWASISKALVVTKTEQRCDAFLTVPPRVYLIEQKKQDVPFAFGDYKAGSFWGMNNWPKSFTFWFQMIQFKYQPHCSASTVRFSPGLLAFMH